MAGSDSTTFYNIPFSAEGYKGMPFRKLGASGLKVPNIGLGTWKIGFPERNDGSRVDEKTAFDLFDNALDLGVTFWDTANRYNSASGNSERIIGNWLKKNPSQRRNVILAPKMGGMMDGITPNHCGLSRTNILDSVYASLERLRVTHIDLLYFHLFDNDISIEESLSAVEDLVRQGVVRYFGVSNFTVSHLRSYQEVIRHLSVRSHISAVQNQFDLLDGERAPYDGVLEFAAENKMSFVAWSPLAKGLLSDRYISENIGAGDRLFDEGQIKAGAVIPHKNTLIHLGGLSKKWGIPVSQLAIAYMLGLPGMGPTIISSSNKSQLVSNAAAGKIKLTEEQKGQIRTIIANRNSTS
jgi:aryl-alcohol dehydrogenase-like predicted oxidoreductase